VNGSYFQSISKKRVIFFTGKGGVGKSALASATALLCQKKGKEVFLISWNPFDYKARAIPYESLGIRHLVLDGPGCFKEYLLTILKFEKLVDLIFDNNVFNTFVSAAPGLSETVIAGKIWDLSEKKKDAIILVDLPSSGHTLSFFSSPLALRHLFKMGLVHREIERICRMVMSPETLIQFVTLAEELPITETLEFRNKLLKQGSFHLAPILVNQCLPAFPGTIPTETKVKQLGNSGLHELVSHYAALKDQESEALNHLKQVGLPYYTLPRLSNPEWLTTVEGISQELETL